LVVVDFAFVVRRWSWTYLGVNGAALVYFTWVVLS
jgi:hypothetical protein